jgi:hypothetical protein
MKWRSNITKISKFKKIYRCQYYSAFWHRSLLIKINLVSKHVEIEFLKVLFSKSRPYVDRLAVLRANVKKNYTLFFKCKGQISEMCFGFSFVMLHISDADNYRIANKYMYPNNFYPKIVSMAQGWDNTLFARVIIMCINIEGIHITICRYIA